MSTRWYPLYQRGGPQLRVFLPNFWMKLVEPTQPQPSNVVQFSCSIEMTKYDIKSYLEKIYDVKPAYVRTRIALGRSRKDPGKGYVVKSDDVKYAYITLPKGETFEFPDLFPPLKEKEEEYERSLRATKERFNEYLEKNRQRPDVPGWYTI